MAQNTLRKKVKPIGPTKKSKSRWNLFKWIEEKINVSGLLGEGVPVRLVPPLFYVALLALIYIWSNHSAENTIRKIEKLQQEVEDIRADVTTLEAEYMYSSKQSEVAKKVEPLGIYEIDEPPLKIIVDK
ncbi:MAG TPA: FtsL-like putative cell division protein [Cyclobacteriaceae bacterium]|nr:FtsL-like putative cell division protein [Cyclobacteriaceae bacterium]